MKKRVWIFNHYAEPPQYEVRVRNNVMAKYLMKAGYDVTIFAASTIHNTDINLITDGSEYIRREYDGLKFVHIKSPDYSGNGLARKINLLLFPFNLWRVTKKIGEKPDVIINDLDVMAFDFPFMIAKRYGVPIITEVRDLWPESLVDYGYLNRDSLLAKFLYLMEKRMYKKSSMVVFTMEAGYEYIKERGWEEALPLSKVRYINNGVDLKVFRENCALYQTMDDDLDDPDTFKVVYAGSIRRVNNLGLLLNAAKYVKNPKVKFLIWGAGDETEELKQRVQEEHIDNVIFKGAVEKKYVPYITTKADLNIAHNTPSPIFRFGISFNKVFDYIAAGKPILSDFPSKFNPAVQWGAGVEVSDPTAENIAKAIEEFANMQPEAYQVFEEKARIAAEEYDYENLTQKMIDLIEA